MGDPISWQDQGDTLSHWFTLSATASGLVERAVPLCRPLFGLSTNSHFVQGSWVFRRAGFLGMAGLAWNCYRAVERLSTSQYRSRKEEIADWCLLFGGAVAFCNVGLGLIRGKLVQDILTQGLAFGSGFLDRMTNIQGALVTLDLATDGYGIWEQYQQWRTRPHQKEFFELASQVGLTLVFGLDRQSRHAIREFLQPEPIVTEMGRMIGQAIRASRVANIDQVRSDPFYLAGILLDKLGLAKSHTYQTAAFYRGHSADSFRVQQAGEALVADKTVWSAIGNDRMRLDAQPLDELLVEILRQSRDTKITRTDLMRAQGMVLSGQFQRYVAQDLYARAREVQRRVGVELECQPPVHPTEKIPATESLFGVEEPRPLTHTEIIGKVQEELVAQGWEQKGWTIELIPPTDIELGPSTLIYPTMVANFEFEGVRYHVRSAQGTGTNMLFAKAGDRDLMIPLRLSGEAKDAPAAVLSRLRANFKSGLEEIAKEIIQKEIARGGSKKKGRTRAEVVGEMSEAIRNAGGERYLHCHVRANGFHQWSYDPDTKRVRLDSLQTKDSEKQLPETYDSFEEAYTEFRALCIGKGKLAAADQHNRLRITKGDKRLELEVTYESNGDVEYLFHHMVAGRDDDRFLRAVAEALKKSGAVGVGKGHQVAQQLHQQMDHDNFSAAATVRTTREVIRSLPLILQGMPPRPIRLRQLQMPRRPEERYAVVDPPGLDQRRRDAVRDLLNGDWDRKDWESVADHRFRIVGRILDQFEDHSSILNLDNIAAYLVRESYKVESPVYIRDGAPAGAVEIGNRTPAPRPELSRRDQALETTFQRYLRMVRSTHNPDIPTAEARWANTPDQLNERGEVELSVDGILQNHRFMTGLLHGAQTGTLWESERGQHYLQIAQRMMDDYLQGELRLF